MASGKVVNALINSKEIVRPAANFSPSIWGDRFDSFILDNQVVEMYEREIETLKERMREMLTNSTNTFGEKLNLIDILERLGISYHFEKEITDQLQKMFNADPKLEKEEKQDLSIVALHFRLLRQHGFEVSSGKFNDFKDNSGRFNENLGSDIKGLLNFYEATHTRIHGEEIFDEALIFATSCLENMPSNLPPSLRKLVIRALEQPLHKGIPRIEAHHYISLYEEDEMKDELVLRLAKFDYNLLQMLHRKELAQLSRWWKKLNLVSKLPYARDRVVECYYWTLGVYYEPKYSHARFILAKTISMISIIDDTFDSYGTVEELEIFNNAVQRWDIAEIDGLPEYMKPIYIALLDLYVDYDEELKKLGNSYAVLHAKERMKEIVNSYYIEAKWFIEGYTPLFEEYLSNALITSTYFLLTTTSLLGMESVAKESFDWLMSNPKVMMASVTICRVVDDIATYDIEKRRGQITTGIDCYMKEYGVSKEEAMKELNRIVENAWVDMNDGCLKPSSLSREVLMRVLNLVRIIDVVYKHNEDGYTNPEKLLKPHVMALLVDPMNIGA